MRVRLALCLIVVSGSSVMAQPSGGPAPAAPPAPTTKPAAEPSPQDTINDLERRAKTPAPAPAPAPAPTIPAPESAPSAVAPTGVPIATAPAAQGRLLREGTFLASRRGRMIRAADGGWLFAFDADRAGKADPSMNLMPCLNLQAMERLVERGGESLSFTLSGQVFVYKGRNYLLPTLYLINRRAEVSPGG